MVCNRLKLSVVFLLLLSFIIMFAGCNNGGSTSTTTGNDSSTVKQLEGGNGIVSAKSDLKGKIRIGYNALSELSGPDPITGRTIYGADELQKWLKKDYPNVDFEIIVYPSIDHYTKAKALMEARQVDVLIESSTSQIWQEGYSMDLTPYIEKDKEYNINLHSSPALATYYREWNPAYPSDESKKIANCLPYDGAGEIMFYDTKMFEDWGVQPLSKNPTLEEVFEKAKKMTGINPKTGQQNYGLYIPTGGKPATWNLATIVNAMNGDSGSSAANEWDIKCKVDSPEWVKALEWLKSVKPFTPPGAETLQGLEKWGTADNNIAVHFNQACTFVYTYESLNLTDRYEPAARPANKNGEHTRLGGQRVQVMKDALDKDLSWEIAKWFSVGNGQRFLMSTQIGWPTSVKALGSDVKMTDEEKKTLEIASHVMKKSPVDSLSLHLIMIDAIESVTLKNVSPIEALQNAEKKQQESYAKLKAAAGK